MKFVPYLLTAILALPSMAMDIKGVKIGMSAEEVKAKFPHLKCAPMKDGREICGDSRPADKPTYSMVAPELESFGGQRVLGFLVQFNGGAVRFVSVRLKSSDFIYVTAALEEKYGPPKVKSDSVVQNRMGAKFDQSEYQWGDEHNIAARRRSSDLSLMEVILRSKALMRQEVEEMKARAKGAAKDL
jgi:hypothetical protein